MSSVFSFSHAIWNCRHQTRAVYRNLKITHHGHSSLRWKRIYRNVHLVKHLVGFFFQPTTVKTSVFAWFHEYTMVYNLVRITISFTGVWAIGCENCSDTSTCHWNSAVWQPHECSHVTMPRKDLKKCLANKQVRNMENSMTTFFDQYESAWRLLRITSLVRFNGAK